MTPEGGCSIAFKKSLLDFLENNVMVMINTRRALNLDEEHVGKKFLQDIAKNISGITAKQLQVINFVFKY